MNTKTFAASLISRSIRTNSIVTETFDPDLSEELGFASDDQATDADAAIREYWGTRNGDTWRIHLTDVPRCYL